MIKKRPYFGNVRTLSTLIDAVAKPHLKKDGYYFATLMLDWPKIVGDTISDNTIPLRLMFPKGQGSGATLTLQVNPAASLIIGFQSGIILEKIAAFYGKRLVNSITLNQSPIPIKTAQKKSVIRNKEHTLPLSMIKTIRKIKNPGLQEALERLGTEIMNCPRKVGHIIMNECSTNEGYKNDTQNKETILKNSNKNV